MPPTPWWRAFATRPARRVAAGAFVYLTGDRTRGVYLLRGGLVQTSLVWRDGGELIHRLVRPGDLFGETHLAAGDSGEQARAIEASEIVEIPTSLLVAHLGREPADLEGFLETLGLRLAQVQETVRRLAFATALERLCLSLLDLARDIGHEAGNVTTIPHHFTQDELGRRIGVRREVVSGYLNRLRDRQVIGYTRTGVIQVNRDALARYALTLTRGEL